MGPRKKRRGVRKKPAKGKKLFRPFKGARTAEPFNSPEIQKIAFHKFVMNLISRPNILSCLLFTPDLIHYKQEFQKFIDFAQDLEEPGKTELAAACFPVFVHCMFNMIFEDKELDADSFYLEFRNLFKNKGYADVLNELSSLSNRKDIEEHAYFKNFRTKKYILKISASTMEKLNSFLKGIESKAVWQAFHLHFYYEDPAVKDEKKTQSQPEQPYIPKEPDEKIIKEDDISFPENSVEHNICDPFIEEPVKWFLSDFKSQGKEDGVVERSSICAIDFNCNKIDFCMSCTARNEEPYLLISRIENAFPDSSNKANHNKRYPIKINFSEPVIALKYHPYLPHILLAASGLEILKVNTITRKVKPFSQGHLDDIFDMDITLTGPLFSTASRDHTCCLWHYKDASVLKTFKEHEDSVNAVRFHPSGIYLVTGSSDWDVRIWNIENSMCVRCLVGHEAEVTLLECCPDKKKLASADTYGIVKLWDIQANELLGDIQCYIDDKPDRSQITSLCFSDENFLGMCNNKGVMRVWDIRKPSVVYNKVYQDIPAFLKVNSSKTWNIFFKDRENMFCENM